MSSEFDNPKRWRPLKPISELESGIVHTSGIHSPKMLELFGRIVSDWVFLEEEMIEVVNLLVFVDYDIRRAAEQKTRGWLPGRQIFRSIGANGVRVKLMRNLLGQFIGNIKKDALYDEVLAEFQSLVNLRNDYIHGMWWTSSDGRIFLQIENVNELGFDVKKEVKQQDFESFIVRKNGIAGKIHQIKLKEYHESKAKSEDDARAASPRKPPEQQS